MFNTIIVLIVSVFTTLWTRLVQKMRPKNQEPETAMVQDEQTSVAEVIDHRYQCPLCWDTLRAPVFIIFDWGQYDHKCTLSKRWCLRCVRMYFELNERPAIAPVKGCIQCGGFKTYLPRNAKNTYRLDTMLMEEMTSKKIVSTCDCGTVFTDQHALHRHLLTECVNSHTGCPVCKTVYKRGDGHRCPYSTCVVCGFESEDKSELRRHVQEHLDAASEQLRRMNYCYR